MQLLKLLIKHNPSDMRHNLEITDDIALTWVKYYNEFP